MDDYLETINLISIDKGFSPMSFEKMPFYWLEGYLERYSEHIEQRIKEQNKADEKGKHVDPSGKFRRMTKSSNYSPKFKPPKM